MHLPVNIAAISNGRLVEGRGTGIPKIMRAIRKNKSPRPTFETDDDRTYFVAGGIEKVKADLERLRAIKTLPQLIAYLRDELDWPIGQDSTSEDISYCLCISHYRNFSPGWNF